MCTRNKWKDINERREMHSYWKEEDLLPKKIQLFQKPATRECLRESMRNTRVCSMPFLYG